MAKRKKGFLRLRVFTFFFAIFVFVLSFSVVKTLLQTKTFSTCANSKTCLSDLTQEIDKNAVGVFEGKKVYPPPIDLSFSDKTAVLGAETATGEKHIYIDLSTQTLYAYQGSTLLLKTLVSTGKWHDTPTGNFAIYEKLVSTRMAGGSGEDAYDLPNVPYVMYFYHDFGLHGAYWHDNFGHKMSHGCVNLRQVDAKKLYEWTDGPTKDTPGTAVSICDQITSDGKCVQSNPVQ